MQKLEAILKSVLTIPLLLALIASAVICWACVVFAAFIWQQFPGFRKIEEQAERASRRYR